MPSVAACRLASIRAITARRIGDAWESGEVKRGSGHLSQPYNSTFQFMLHGLKPFRIYLFGSRAEGRARPDSDFDLVVVFEEDTVTGVLLALRPEVHAKGTDYTVDSVPEREVVERYGGRTVICGDPKDHATTDLIGIILDRFG